MNNLVDIREVSSGPDLLESIFNVPVVVHLVLHLLLQEGGIQSLYQELFLHLDFVLIFVLISCHLSDVGLSLDSLHLVFEGFFLVSDGLLKTNDSLVSLLLVLLELVENLLQLHFCLDSLLLGPPLLFSFLLGNVVLGLHRLFELLRSELG